MSTGCQKGRKTDRQTEGQAYRKTDRQKDFSVVQNVNRMSESQTDRQLLFNNAFIA